MPDDERRPGPARTILLVDDEPDVLSSMRDLLEAEVPDVRVLATGSPSQALDWFREESPDLILADYLMPGIDGLALLTKAREQHPEVPRVLMTAYADLVIAVRAINEAHVERFVQKPFDPPELVEAVKAVLEERHAAQQRRSALRRALEQLPGHLRPEEPRQGR